MLDGRSPHAAQVCENYDVCCAMSVAIKLQIIHLDNRSIADRQ